MLTYYKISKALNISRKLNKYALLYLKIARIFMN